MGSELTITDKQDGFSESQLAVLNQIGVRNASKADLEMFFHRVQSTGLDPFAGQIYMIERQGKQTIQTGIDGFRLIARRAVSVTGERFGEPETLWCGMDHKWVDVWLNPNVPPAAAKVIVQRGEGAFSATATYTEYVGRKRDGSVNSMWRNKPAIMLAKCAEALALRKAFPQDLSKLYTFDEMNSADVQETTMAEPVQVVQPSPSKEDCEKIFRLMADAGVDDQNKAMAAFKALTGRDGITATAQLTLDEAEALLSAPELVTKRVSESLKGVSEDAQ